ncbi:EpsG family protein [Dyadobacter endophyticus]|uniref:Polysaccharide polymerase n=2 Tax=Dyadobacter endophyticus TaxID=1749036 RepID=A0ABQ1YVH0_9BACT|nr:polysaccharide polymerase [Dyadobacter endophyticus]
MLYYTVFCILILFALLEMVTVPEQTKKAMYIFLTLSFIVMGGLRWNTGNDWRPYHSFFTKFTTDDPFFLIAMEPGYVKFVQFLRIFSSSFTFYLIVLSTIAIGIKTTFFYKYAGAIFLAVILYWGTALADITAVRQTLAVSLCVLSSHFIIERKPWLFVFFVILAAQIHVTSYIFLVSYFIFNAEWSVRSKSIILIVAVAIGASGISESLLELIANITPAGIGLDRISQKALNYLEIGNEVDPQYELSKTQRLTAAIAKRAILLPVFFYFQERVTIRKDLYKGFLNLYTFGNILFFIVVDFITLQRAATYFYFYEILLLCIIYVNVKSKSIWLILIIAYSLFKMLSILVNAMDLLVPYIWIFSEDTYRFVY